MLSQSGATNTIDFTILVNGVEHVISAVDAIEEGVTAVWTVSVDNDGLMTVEKDGAIVAQGQGDVQLAIGRDQSLVGEGNLPTSEELNGQVDALICEGDNILAPGSLTGREDDDVLIGDTGSDTTLGLGGDESLTGDEGDDSLVGGDGEIEGLYGNDEIDAGAGADHVFARDGDDLVYGDVGNDTLIGGIGTDTIYGGDGNDLLAGSQGNDEIHDGAGNDLINSGNGADTIYGGDGNDRLNGGAENDFLHGGAGNDTLTGGSGDDVFTIQAAEGSVTILDFAVNGDADQIDISALSEIFADPEALMAALSYDDGQSSLTFDVDGDTSNLTIISDNELDLDDFIF